MVETSREDLGALGVEDCLGDFSFVALEDGGAGEGGDVVHPHGHIHAGSDQTGPDGVEVEIQDLIGVSTQD